MKKIILLTIIFILVIFEIIAQAPEAFKYQTVVRDNTGAILTNRTVNFRITIRRSSEAGTIVYRETYTPMPQTNQFGIVNLNIGTGVASTGSISSINWETYPHYLQIEVDINGGTTWVNMGASQLLSVPYALHANTSASNLIQDADKNTKVTTENAANENYIRFYTNGGERLRITPSGKFETGAGITSVYFGDGAGKNNVGSYNVIIGDSAAAKATGMTSSIAVGYRALYATTSGDYNAAIGALALENNTTGNRNTGIGRGALRYNKSGSYNSGIGYYALGSNSTGNNNTALGYYALFNNLTSSNSIALGSYALYSQTGYTSSDTLNNIAIGNNTLYHTNATSDLTGRNNIAIGQDALYTNTFGDNNIAIGGRAMFYNVSGYYNTAVGTLSLLQNKGNGNTALGRRSGDSNISGSYNTFIGYYADASTGSITNSAAIGYNSVVNASNKVIIGNSSVTAIGGYAAWSNYSDIRLKENINYTNDLGLNFINKLRTVSYNYISDENKRRRDGLIAQDVQKSLKELGIDFSGLIIDDDKNKTLNLSYSEFIIPLINAVQQLSKQNQELTKRIEALEKQIKNK